MSALQFIPLGDDGPELQTRTFVPPSQELPDFTEPVGLPPATAPEKKTMSTGVKVAIGVGGVVGVIALARILRG
jgi:hypothetical protein